MRTSRTIRGYGARAFVLLRLRRSGEHHDLYLTANDGERSAEVRIHPDRAQLLLETLLEMNFRPREHILRCRALVPNIPGQIYCGLPLHRGEHRALDPIDPNTTYHWR